MDESLKPWLYGGVAVCFALALFFEIDVGWIILLLLIYIILLAIGYAVHQNVTINKLQTKLPDSLKYDSEDGIVYLNSREKSHAKRFSIENYEGTKMGYTEEKLIFTSATVGGITTGGVDKVGGYHTEKIKTDRYNLFFEYIDPSDHMPKKFCVQEIILAENLVSEAEASYIRGYVEKNRIVVVTPLVTSDSELNAYAKLRELNGGGFVPHMANINEDDRIRTMPGREKCIKIRDWISNK